VTKICSSGTNALKKIYMHILKMIKRLTIPGSIKKHIEDDIEGMRPGKGEIQVSVNLLPSNYIHETELLVPEGFMHFISPKLPKERVSGEEDLSACRILTYRSKNRLQLLWYVIKGRWMSNILEDSLKEMEKSGKVAGVVQNFNFSLEPGEGNAFIRDFLGSSIGKIGTPYTSALLVGYKNRGLEAYNAGTGREPIEIGYA
jgi:hypothetical protein